MLHSFLIMALSPTYVCKPYNPWQDREDGWLNMFSSPSTRQLRNQAYLHLQTDRIKKRTQAQER